MTPQTKAAFEVILNKSYEEHGRPLFKRELMELMSAAYNLALIDASEAAEVEIGEYHRASVDKQSILDIKIT